jgi:hypothetical protein
MTAAAMFCALCGLRLATVTTRAPNGTLQTSHTHHEPADHRPVPVPPGLVDHNPICDFCGTPGPSWTLPVADIAHTHRPGAPRFYSGGDWNACDLCAAHIRAGDWDGMAARAVRLANARQRHPGHPQRDGRSAASLNRFWQLVRDNTTGPLRPLEEKRSAET